MIEGLLSIGSYLLKLVVQASADAVRSVVRTIAKDLGFQGADSEAATLARGFLGRMKTVAREEEELKLKERRDHSLSRADKERVRELSSERESLFRQYGAAKQRAVIGATVAAPEDYAQTALSDERTNVLQYHLGMVRLEKSCPNCRRPMVLNHRIGGGHQLQDFFWSCTSFYEKGAASVCKVLNIDLKDLALLHRKDVPELQVKGSELTALIEQPLMVKQVTARMEEHRNRDEDPEVLCPVHHIPMLLQRKREHDGTLLDMYHLRCPYLRADETGRCPQMVKLKSTAQIASYLARVEGRGILA